MLTKELHFELPEELIAQSPSKKRDESRLLVFNRKTQSLSHHYFYELPKLLPPCLSIVRNDVSVFKARIHGNRNAGGKVECLLLSPYSNSKLTWKCLIKPGSKTAKSKIFGLEHQYRAEVIDTLPSGEYLVAFELFNDSDPLELAQRIGSVPLPPYVRRKSVLEDEKRYQTVYANNEKLSAVAAPTAGLHFTDKIFNELLLDGHKIFNLTLSVGIGTFRPIECEKVEDHPMHPEKYSIDPATKKILLNHRSNRLAVGTTSVRAIEHYLSNDDYDLESPTTHEAKIFIKPPYEFLGVDHLITNFHLPGSTLLCLVGAFLKPSQPDGIEQLKEIYYEAIQERYRFFSYGDAMLII